MSEKALNAVIQEAWINGILADLPAEPESSDPAGVLSHLAALPGSLHAQRTEPRQQGEPVGGACGTATGVRADRREKRPCHLRKVAGQWEKSNPAVTGVMDEAEADVLASFGLPKAHQVKTHSTTTLERLNKEVKRRADVVGIFPNEESITRLLGAVLTEQNE